MQSKKSFFSGTICKKNLTHFWPIWILYTIVLVCIVPIQLFVNTSVGYSGYTAAELDEYKNAGFLQTISGGMFEGTFTVMCLVVSLITAMAVFSYLYNNRSAHMFHSLPVTRRELFITNYLSGLVMLVVPVVTVFMISMVVCVVRGITSLEYLMAWLIMVLGESFFFYSMAILVAMFTGQLLAMPVFTVIFNFLYIGCRYIVTSLMGTISYGLSNSYANRKNSILSPVIYMCNKIGIRYEYVEDELGYNGHMQGSIVGLKYIGIYCIVAVVFTIVAYILYKRRKMERNGDMLCISGTRPVFRWGFAVCASFLMAMLIANIFDSYIRTPRAEFIVALVTSLITGFLAFFIADMFLKKKMNVFSKRRFIECGVMLALSAAFLIGIEVNAFGLETKIPDESDIASADISMYYNIQATEEADIERIMAIHRQIIEAKQEYETYQCTKFDNYDTRYVEVDYKLKDGDSIVRTYYVPDTSEYLENSDSVASQIYAMSVEPENYLKGNLCENYQDVKAVSMSLDMYDDNLDYSSLELNTQQSQQLYSAYLKDILEGHVVLDIGEGDDPQIYINSLMTNLELEGGVKVSWTESRYAGSYKYRSYTANLILNTKCKYTIEALQKLGLIDEEHPLMTQKEYTELCKRIYGDGE